MYKGRANTLTVQETGKTYYRYNPETHKNDFDEPIEINEQSALSLAARSRMHVFEMPNGDNLLDKATEPELEAAKAPSIVPQTEDVTPAAPTPTGKGGSK